MLYSLACVRTLALFLGEEHRGLTSAVLLGQMTPNGPKTPAEDSPPAKVSPIQVIPLAIF